jgi:hypothetical protein
MKRFMTNDTVPDYVSTGRDIALDAAINMVTAAGEPDSSLLPAIWRIFEGGAADRLPITVVKGLLRSNHGIIQSFAIEFCRETNYADSRIHESLVMLARQTGIENRWLALRCLAERGDGAATEICSDIVNNGSDDEKQMAAIILGFSNDAAAMHVLRVAFTEMNNRPLRIQAAVSLTMLGDLSHLGFLEGELIRRERRKKFRWLIGWLSVGEEVDSIQIAAVLEAANSSVGTRAASAILRTGAAEEKQRLKQYRRVLSMGSS